MFINGKPYSFLLSAHLEGTILSRCCCWHWLWLFGWQFLQNLQFICWPGKSVPTLFQDQQINYEAYTVRPCYNYFGCTLNVVELWLTVSSSSINFATKKSHTAPAIYNKHKYAHVIVICCDVKEKNDMYFKHKYRD